MMQSLVFSASGLSFILLAYLVIRCVASPLPVLRSRRRLFPKRPIGVSAVSAGTKTSKIGRASCRERVVSVRVDLGGRRSIKNKRKTHQNTKSRKSKTERTETTKTRITQ